jgi:hypothetical protein
MPHSDAPPSATDQLQFLARVQRFLDSGRFTATYKFALFLALAELAVEQGDDFGGPLRLPLDAIADRFLSMYWRQAAPYAANDTVSVLRQNTNQQAAVITRISQAHRTLGVSLGAVRAHREWTALVGTARNTIITMPLLRLQTIDNNGTASPRECFLYENSVPEHDLELLPGVAFCLRRFFPLLQGMVRAKWLGWVQAHNRDVLGGVQDLAGFMFGADRGNVRAITGALLELQKGRCFYRPHVLLDAKTAEVDHFIPWAKYPCDAVTNFVLASPTANAKKKDYLPAVEYLDRWHNRNDRHRDLLANAALSAGIQNGDGSIHRIAAWAYGSHAAIDGLVWHASAGLIPLDPRWQQILTVYVPITPPNEK